MLIVPTSWSFKRATLLPLLVVMGECAIPKTEMILLDKAIDLIEKAEKFKGIPYPTDSIKFESQFVSVNFSVLFPSDKELEAFMETIDPQKN